MENYVETIQERKPQKKASPLPGIFSLILGLLSFPPINPILPIISILLADKSIARSAAAPLGWIGKVLSIISLVCQVILLFIAYLLISWQWDAVMYQFYAFVSGL